MKIKNLNPRIYWDNKTLYLNNPAIIPYTIYIYTRNIRDLEAKCTVHDLSNL